MTRRGPACLALMLMSHGGASALEFQVNTVTGGNPQLPDVAVATDGSFVVTWSSNTSAWEDVFARRYDPSGNPLGAQFQVNSHTTGLQH